MTDQRYLPGRLSSEQGSRAVLHTRKTSIFADIAARHRYEGYDAEFPVEAVVVAVIRKPAL